MILSSEEVRKVAALARLELSEAEIEQYREQLSAVLSYVEQLNELALDEIEGTARAVPQHNVWREDDVNDSLPLEDVLHNAAKKAADQFLIQTVLSEES